MNLGIIGIALTMVCDWSARAVLTLICIKTGRWKEFEVIKLVLYKNESE